MQRRSRQRYTRWNASLATSPVARNLAAILERLEGYEPWTDKEEIAQHELSENRAASCLRDASPRGAGAVGSARPPTRTVRGDGSRRRRGRDADIPWGQFAAAPRPRSR